MNSILYCFLVSPQFKQQESRKAQARQAAHEERMMDGFLPELDDLNDPTDLPITGPAKPAGNAKRKGHRQRKKAKKT